MSASPPITVTPETKLADIVTADVRYARVLERFGLDYCCKGQRTLQEAMESSSHKIEDVTAALSLPLEEAPKPTQGERSLAALGHEIVDIHHAYLWEEMPRLQKIVEKVARVHGDRHPELARVLEVYTALVADLEPHLTVEERFLFPAISKLERTRQPVTTSKGSLEEVVKNMMTEHDKAGEMLRELRQLTRDYTTPEDGCNTYRVMNSSLLEFERDLHLHIHKENNILLPDALKLAQEIANSK